MATPIRLLFGNNNAIHLNAQTLDISVDRKVSTFPTPGAILERFAIDTNTPAVDIEISGILIDDDVNNLNQSIEISAPALGVISLSNFIPTTVSEGPNSNIVDTLNQFENMENFIVKQDYNKIESNLIRVKSKSYINNSNVRRFLHGGAIASVTASVTSSATFNVINYSSYNDRDIRVGDILVNGSNSAFIGQVSVVGDKVEGVYQITLSTGAVTLAIGTNIGLRRSIFNEDGDSIGTVISCDPNIVSTAYKWHPDSNTNGAYLDEGAGPVQINHPSGAGNIYAIGTTVALPTKTKPASDRIAVGYMIYNGQNERIGVVTAVGASSVTIGGGTLVPLLHDEHLFVQNNPDNVDNVGNKATGRYQAIAQLRLSDVNSVALYNNEKIFIGGYPATESALDGEYLILVPSYWQQSSHLSPARRNLTVRGTSKRRPQGIRLLFDASSTHPLFGGTASGVLINNGDGYPAGTTAAMAVDGVNATTKFTVGDVLYNSKSTKLGIITAVSTNSITVGTGTLGAVIDDENLPIGIPSVTRTAQQAVASRTGGWGGSRTNYYASDSDAIINIPVNGLTTSTRYGNEDYPNLSQDPSHNLALILKEAIELTTDITYNTAATAPGSQTVAGAFSAEVSNGTILIRQKYTPTREFNFYDILSETNISFASDFSKNSATKGGQKSAGDKVQDLLGLMANARKGADLFRGIQIPYQSLITSDNVTGSARNFFLTFGDIPPSEKGSVTNTRDASKYMENIITQDGGSVQEETTPSKVEKILSDTFPNIHAFGEFLIGTLETIYVTLSADAHGNQGGIRIIPEKFHVRYDAGNKYYAYSLKLKASDFVIGV